jgi:hypothetical protein
MLPLCGYHCGKIYRIFCNMYLDYISYRFYTIKNDQQPIVPIQGHVWATRKRSAQLPHHGRGRGRCIIYGLGCMAHRLFLETQFLVQFRGAVLGRNGDASPVLCENQSRRFLGEIRDIISEEYRHKLLYYSI